MKNIISTTAIAAIELDEIQGNLFGGFSKDFQTFIFFSVIDPEKAKKFLADIVLPDVEASSSAHVLAFNHQFKALKQSGCPEGIIKATWTNIAFTHRGLNALKLPSAQLDAFSKPLRDGMRARATTIGDTETSAPKNWYKHYKTDYDSIHAIIIVAADSVTDLHTRVARYSPPSDSGIRILFQQEGRTRVDNRGHEHFGFKDGVSQPGVRGIDNPDDVVANPNQGHPGQDLLWPGEFVIGYPTQIPKAATKPDGKPVDGPNPTPGPLSGPAGAGWMKNGAYLVFRRLHQDVNGFNRFLAHTAAQYGLTPDLFGAKLVGRYKSGAPLEKLAFQSEASTQSPSDPGLATVALAENDGLNNNFEYGDDDKGRIVPFSSHIRKAYPRNEDPSALNGGPPNPSEESETQTHRLLRRGIPFGVSLGGKKSADDPLGNPDEEDGSPDGQRGLLFLAYQSDLERQFEFVQSQWVNDADFPLKDAGKDPIMSQDPKSDMMITGCPFHAKPPQAKCPVPISRFVTTTGGDYFFAPSLSFLQQILGT